MSTALHTQRQHSVAARCLEPVIFAVEGYVPDADAVDEAVARARREHSRILLLVGPRRVPYGSTLSCYVACCIPPPQPPDGEAFAREVLDLMPADVPVTVQVVEFGFMAALRRELAAHQGAHLVLGCRSLRRRHRRRRWLPA